MILNHYAAPLAQRDSWLEGIEIYDDYAESPYQKMAAVLKRMGLDRETVGFEKTYLSAARWEEIGTLLPGVNAFDCTEMMDRVRWIKTPAEVFPLITLRSATSAMPSPSVPIRVLVPPLTNTP